MGGDHGADHGVYPCTPSGCRTVGLTVVLQWVTVAGTVGHSGRYSGCPGVTRKVLDFGGFSEKS